MRYGFVFANGEITAGAAVSSTLGLLRRVKSRLVVAADGGLRHILAHRLTPDVLIGDLDSADPADVERLRARGVEVQTFPTHKDETDLELALREVARRGCDVIRILGAVGGRLDQTISNVYLLAMADLRDRDVALVDGNQTVRLIVPDEHILHGQPGDTVSLIPLAGSVSGIVTSGLEYPLKDELLRFGPARGVSNVMLTDSASIRFRSGNLLVIHTAGKA